MRMHLIGNEFEVIVEGGQCYRRGTVRDTMGDDCYATWRWFEGSGKVVEKSTGKESMFLLRTPHIEFGSQRTLEEHMFSYHQSLHAKPLREVIIAGREPYLADVIARQVLAEIASDKQNIVPHCRLGNLDYGQLVAQGVIAGWNGEVALPGLVAV